MKMRLFSITLACVILIAIIQRVCFSALRSFGGSLLLRPRMHWRADAGCGMSTVGGFGELASVLKLQGWPKNVSDEPNTARIETNIDGIMSVWGVFEWALTTTHCLHSRRS